MSGHFKEGLRRRSVELLLIGATSQFQLVINTSIFKGLSVNITRLGYRFGVGLSLLALSNATTIGAEAQDRLPTAAGFARYLEIGAKNNDLRQKLARETVGSVVWLPDGSGFEYEIDGKFYRFSYASKESTPIERQTSNAQPSGGRNRRRGGGGLERGRQAASMVSPDSRFRAFYKDANLYLTPASQKSDTDAKAITTEGDASKRIKYGTGSWVYGEELAQTTAFWWSPNSKKIAFYRFDESKVKDFYLAMNTVDVQDKLDVEPYPKSGTPNPVVDLLVYDLESGKTTQFDIRDGKPFENQVLGYYVYDVRWSPDGKELLCNRTNRRQNRMEVVACNPESGKVRVILHEEWLPSWVENHPEITFLKDNFRFLLTSERTGYKNLYLYDLSGKRLETLTSNSFDMDALVRVDESAGYLYYTAHDGDNPLKIQLHRVGLDGRDDVRLTDPSLTHQIDLAPDGKFFIDRAEAHNIAPSTQVMDAAGKLVSTLLRAKTGETNALPNTEIFSYMGADGKTVCYGRLQKPSNFNPSKKYPLLVSVYGGPESGSLSERFSFYDSTPELGFLVAEFDGRGVKGRGKAHMDAVYEKLGIVEMDDQAAGVKFLRERPYVDGTRVGIHGTSYGGYSSAMCLLRHPDVFQAACAQSAVTDWRNYDTIYTERYMWIPEENKSGYDAGAAMTYASALKGRLMLYYGTADNNVHPNNTMQLIRALQRAGKSFEVQVGPDQGHSAVNQRRMMEFFIDNLKP